MLPRSSPILSVPTLSKRQLEHADACTAGLQSASQRKKERWPGLILEWKFGDTVAVVSIATLRGNVTHHVRH